MDARAFLAGAPRRVLRSLTTLPRTRDLAELGLAALALAVLVGPAGLWTGLLVWRPRALGEVLALALPAFIAPGLGEELPFRALLIPDRGEAPGAGAAIAVSTALFCLWHVVEAETFLPGAQRLFLRPDFLAWTVLLGLACAALRRRSGSIWPPALLHWAAVVAWEGWLGGPGLDALR